MTTANLLSHSSPHSSPHSSQIDTLRDMLANSQRTVFFGGAGVSTESGIPDFRSPDGLYSLNYEYPPEEIVSHSFFMRETAEFYRFYVDKMLLGGKITDIRPNDAHLYLAKHKIPVITQNIDGLHDLANSMQNTQSEILELHGSVMRNFCQKCQQFYDFDALLNRYNASDDGIPRCSREVLSDGQIAKRECRGVIKPDVVLYEEGLDNDVLQRCIRLISEANTLIIGGTSLTVYPASGLVRYFKGQNLVIINKTPTDIDNSADLVISAKIGEIFSQL